MSAYRRLIAFLRNVILHHPGTSRNLSKSMRVQKVFGTDLGEHLYNSYYDSKFRELNLTPSISFPLYGIFNEAYVKIASSFHLWIIDIFKWRVLTAYL
jgi:hypothetical protein